MKKSLIVALIGFACSVAPSFGQGTIILDNYNAYPNFPMVTYGASNIPKNGVSGQFGTLDAGLDQGWTAGLYYTLGDTTASIASDPTGVADPSALGGGLTLGTGAGSTAGFTTSAVGFLRGYFLSGSVFSVPGTSSSGGDTITVMMVAYNTSAGDYADASWRGHSAAYTMLTSSNVSVTPHRVGDLMPPFSVFAVPEPSTFALAVLISLCLALRRGSSSMLF